MNLLLALSIFTLSVAPALAPATAQEWAGSERGRRDVRVLELTGTPHERGLAHGRALKDEIHDILGDFKRDLEQKHGVKAAEFIERFLAETDFMPAIEQWTPGLLDEVRGIAEGAELPFEELYVFQLADEIWSMGGWAMRSKCTAVAVGPRGLQPSLVAQNMDLPAFYQKYPTLLRIRYDEGPDALVLTCPGLIGVNGMNSASVAVACNTLLQLRPSREGVPCLFVVRGVLEQEDASAAEAFLKSVPHAVGQNYTIGDPDGVRAFECSAGDQVQFLPKPDGDFTYHTNHPLVNRDWHPDYLERCEAKGVEPEVGLRKCWRFVSLTERFAAGKPITIDSILDALSSRDEERGPICGDWTYGCTIFVLKNGEPELQFAPGRPDRIEVRHFYF